MKYLLKTGLFCLSTLLATPVLATPDRPITPILSNPPLEATQFGYSASAPFKMELLPNTPLMITNILRWSINAECSLVDQEAPADVTFKLLRKTGSLNEITLSRGESLSMTVKPEDVFAIVAEPGATVEITNESEEKIVVNCSASVS